jgi:hypothetical protein
MTSELDFDAATLAQRIATAQQNLAERSASGLADVQAALDKRGAALHAAAKTAPTLTGIARRAELYQSLASSIGAARLDFSRLPKASADAFVLHGQVLDSTGAPRDDASVSLSDASGTVDRRLPAARTDDNGYYTITLRVGEFPELEAGRTHLFVSIVDDDDREIAKPTQPVMFQPGRVAVMPVVG